MPEDRIFASTASVHTWLVVNLRSAATRVGCVSWWSLEDIATAVRLALFTEVQPVDAALPDLQNKIATALHDIGCPELATSFQLAHPVLRVSLIAFTRSLPLDSEEEFFARLRSQIEAAWRGGIQSLHLTDLAAWEAGLAPLDGSFPWCTPALDRAKIVTFVRRHLRSVPLSQSLCCVIS